MPVLKSVNLRVRQSDVFGSTEATTERVIIFRFA